MATAPRSNPRTAKSIGDGDKGSRAQAENAHKRTAGEQYVNSEAWPRNQDGRPMVKIAMQASELIPTGQYANVSIGPATITAFVDPDSEAVFDDHQRENISKALNDLAEIVEGDVIAVQRNLVLESLQDQISS